MGRIPCCDKANVKRGAWSPEEDTALKDYLQKHGTTGGNWIALPRQAGLKRCGKSCRLRWLNYLRHGIKHGGFTEEEDNIIFILKDCSLEGLKMAPSPHNLLRNNLAHCSRALFTQGEICCTALLKLLLCS